MLAELLTNISKNDKASKKELFQLMYAKFFSLAQRYAKSDEQAEQLFFSAFEATINKVTRLISNKKEGSLEKEFEKEFTWQAANFIREIRSEYYVASTVYATQTVDKTFDLFENNEIIDFNAVDNDVLKKCLQQLVPSQRLVFNLQVIENYSPEETAQVLEASEQTVKSTLEKARYNLQKNIEKALKVNKHEQPL
jgi:RNA polymerase sigma factor (sigma-70 family)